MCLRLCCSRPAWRGGGERAAGLVRAVTRHRSKTLQGEDSAEPRNWEVSGRGVFISRDLFLDALPEGPTSPRNPAVAVRDLLGGSDVPVPGHLHGTAGCCATERCWPGAGICQDHVQNRRDACVRPVHSSLSLTFRLNYTSFRTPLVGWSGALPAAARGG